jgi:hypothetical protein
MWRFGGGGRAQAKAAKSKELHQTWPHIPERPFTVEALCWGWIVYKGI